MRPCVRVASVALARHFEGPTCWMYLDVLGLVTTGYGNLIASPQSAVALPWRQPDGSLASRDEILAEWSSVRKRTDLAPHGGGAFACVTRLRLDAAGVAHLVDSTLERFDSALARRYAEWEDWPACAQMACLSLAWACGAAYAFPRMDLALARGDFEAASGEIEMTPEHNPGNHLEGRNKANRVLMRNAAHVVAFGLDPDMIDWAHELGPVEPSVSPLADTLPAQPIVHEVVETVAEAQRRDE